MFQIYTKSLSFVGFVYNNQIYFEDAWVKKDISKDNRI